MPDTLNIIEEPILFEDEEYLLRGEVIIEDNEPIFTLHFEMLDHDVSDEGRFMSLDVKFSVENPLIEGGIVIVAATTYALCIAKAGVKFGIKAVRRCYRHSSSQNPNASATERVRDIANCLSEQGGGAKEAIVSALSDCIPLKRLFDGEDDEGEDNL